MQPNAEISAKILAAAAIVMRENPKMPLCEAVFASARDFLGAARFESMISDLYSELRAKPN